MVVGVLVSTEVEAPRRRTDRDSSSLLQFFEDLFEFFLGLTESLLQFPVQLILFSFHVEQVVIRKVGELLLQLALQFIPAALDAQTAGG